MVDFSAGSQVLGDDGGLERVEYVHPGVGGRGGEQRERGIGAAEQEKGIEEDLCPVHAHPRAARGQGVPEPGAYLVVKGVGDAENDGGGAGVLGAVRGAFAVEEPAGGAVEEGGVHGGDVFEFDGSLHHRPDARL
ncbi:hypothetical protein [Streptomyces sp. NPDC006285]|uniref:hypothetical protein n=1 Tax=Streptomyces sp. NPDC006285 TaxID=3364742 RepID=UPI00369EC9B7